MTSGTQTSSTSTASATSLLKPPSVNRGVERRLAAMIEAADGLRVHVSKGAAGETLIDAGASVPGSLEAGRLITEICLGGLGTASIAADTTFPRYSWSLTVHTWQPVVACLASQYAGWQLTSGEGESSYFSMGSGPARALAAKEELFKDIAYLDDHTSGVLVLETGSPPPEELVRRIADDCKLNPERLTIVYAPTQSLAGTVQIIGRVVEVAMHKAHVLHFDLSRIIVGVGTAPLAPPHPDFITAMGRTNDAVIYGGRVLLHVAGPAAEAKALAEALPSSTSKDYGTPFAEIFRQYEGDFYKIDGSLFSPAEVAVVALETGETFRAGGIDARLIDASFD